MRCILISILLVAFPAIAVAGDLRDDINGLFEALRGRVITPEEQTRGALLTARIRILSYAAEHRRLPDKLADVPERSGYDDKPTDGWGKPLVYLPQPDGSVILRSLGVEGGGNTRSMRFSAVDPADREGAIAMSDTFDRMDVIERFLRHYAEEHQTLPAVLPADHPQPQGVDLPFGDTDGWGGKISYAPRASGKVLLASQGKDGKQVFSVEFIVPGVKANTPATMPAQTGAATTGPG